MAALGERPRQRLVHALGEQEAVQQHGQARPLSVLRVGQSLAVEREAAHRPSLGAMPVIRPMTEDDIEAVHEAAVATFEDLSRRFYEPPDPRPDPLIAHLRFRHLVRTDPGGAWVAEDERGIGGCALALRREGIWGLSLLIVRPDLQSAGVGRELLERATEYADGARGRIILSSPAPRAFRAYSRLGLTLHPTLSARGKPHGVEDPHSTRAGTEADIPFTEAVDRHVRGAAHGADIGV